MRGANPINSNAAPISVFATILLFVASLSYAEERGPPDAPFTLAIAGDMIGPFHPMHRLGDPQFAKVAKLFRNADAGFANQEGSIFDLRRFVGYPAAETGGGYVVQQPSIARDIRDMGISLVSKANNHATDWGTEGLVETLDNLNRAGLVFGGAGLSDSAARQPVYLDTRKGLVALVATASTFTPSSVAGAAVVLQQDAKSNPRPGISPLHVREVRLLPPALFASLRQAAGPLAISEGSAIRIGDQVFRQDKSMGTVWEMERSDEDTILGAVDEAKARASLVLFSIHAHETAGDDDEPPPIPFEPMVLHKADEAPSPNDPRPAGFEVELFHAAVDRGADVVIRHGPHVIGGIEIYKGKPIFYSLGSLFLDFSGRRVINTPGGEKFVVPDFWFESVVPVCVFSAHRLQMIKLYPITIEPNARDRSGIPSTAGSERGRAILERLKELSAAFGTKVEISDGVGLVRVPAG
jgi:poly-gamma-glutamate capsule biosynthesis protein CapA/YwtB (metallophosphatase superfamily)